MTERMVVGAAILRDGRLLAAQRRTPADLAGLWELPGGKVEPGETDRAALARECLEELGVTVEVLDRVGGDTALPAYDATLRVFAARVVAGEPTALEHLALRWLERDEIAAVTWLPSNLPLLPALAARLVAEERQP